MRFTGRVKYVPTNQVVMASYTIGRGGRPVVLHWFEDAINTAKVKIFFDRGDQYEYVYFDDGQKYLNELDLNIEESRIGKFVFLDLNYDLTIDSLHIAAQRDLFDELRYKKVLNDISSDTKLKDIKDLINITSYLKSDCLSCI